MSHSHWLQKTAARTSRVLFSETESTQSAPQSYPEMPPSRHLALWEGSGEGRSCKALSNRDFLLSNAAELDSWGGTEYQPTATWG